MALFVITGVSGSGKTTIAKELENEGVWKGCISCTTRTVRDGEIDGKDYYFVAKDTFEEMVEKGEFVEYAEYDNNYYGTLKSEIETLLSAGKDTYVIVEYQGYLQIKEKYPEAIGIFLYMEKEQCMANMLYRGDKFDKALSRIEKYEDEMSAKGEYDYVVKNVKGKINKTSSIIYTIVRQNST